MKELYSVGQTARLLGVTVKTLRYYEAIGLVLPAYINSETGYRYYASRQFQRIDRIKYLQSLGFSLDEIRASIENVDDLVALLGQKKTMLKQQREELTRKIEDVDWYLNYFHYMENRDACTDIYLMHLPQRFGIVVPHSPDELSREAEIRLASLRGQEPYNSLTYLRQYGYLMDYQQMKQDRLFPKGYFIFLKNRPAEELPNLIEFPDGTYLCFVLRIQNEFPRKQWDHTSYLEMLRGQPDPTLVLANEYEDNLHQFASCKYEFQILMDTSTPRSQGSQTSAPDRAADSERREASH